MTVTDQDIEKMPVEITGTLKNARRVFNDEPRSPNLYGDIYGDIRGRFNDGERIFTSRIQSEDGDIFKTLFSVYKVEFAEGEK